MTTLREKRLRKRFAAFLVCSGLLYVGLFAADPATFDTYAKMIAAIFGAYLGGQSATDWQKAKNGNTATRV